MPIAARACRRRARTPDGPPGTLRAVRITAESRVDFFSGGPRRSSVRSESSGVSFVTTAAAPAARAVLLGERLLELGWANDAGVDQMNADAGIAFGSVQEQLKKIREVRRTEWFHYES